MNIVYLNECFSVDFTTGVLVWKVRPVSHFNCHAKCTKWNKRFSGNVACKENGAPYKRVYLDGKFFYSHRIIAALFYEDELENLVVDHYNKYKFDNSISNLRVCRQVINMKNLKLYSTNSTGISGISVSGDYYLVELSASKKKDRKRKYVKDFFEACCIRKSWLNSSDYTNQHGLYDK